MRKSVPMWMLPLLLFIAGAPNAAEAAFLQSQPSSSCFVSGRSAGARRAAMADTPSLVDKEERLESGFSTATATTLSSSSPDGSSITFDYTHLEVNGMLWQFPQFDDNATIVIDPISSQLDFGIPDLYRANKKVLNEQETLDRIVQAQPSHCLLSQGLDDHTHLPTLSKLRHLLPHMHFIVAPSARDKLASIFPDEDEREHRMTMLRPGRSISLSPHLRLFATKGALVGPPWQARENGWLLQVTAPAADKNDGRADDCIVKSIYTEPHSDVIDDDLRGLRADVMVSPVKQQALSPSPQLAKYAKFKLVHGGRRTLEIAELLGATKIIPLGNGDLDIQGPLASFVAGSGIVQEFEQLCQDYNSKNNAASRPEITVEPSTPGERLRIQL